MEQRWALARRAYAQIPVRRAAFRAFLARVEVDPQNGHELVFGELITNAVKYGDDPMSVAVAVSGGRLRIEVESFGHCFALADRLAKEPTPMGGRGLKIVNALAERLTVEQLNDRTCRVTATLPI